MYPTFDSPTLAIIKPARCPRECGKIGIGRRRQKFCPSKDCCFDVLNSSKDFVSTFELVKRFCSSKESVSTFEVVETNSMAAKTFLFNCEGAKRNDD